MVGMGWYIREDGRVLGVMAGMGRYETTGVGSQNKVPDLINQTHILKLSVE